MTAACKDKPAPEKVAEEDIYEAMREIDGYLDITPGDLKEVYLAAYRFALDRLKRTVKAADVMRTPVHSVATTTPLAEAAALMAAQGVSGLPVLDAAGRVAGMLTEHDFLSRLAGRESRSFMAVLAECLGSRKCAALSVRGRLAEDIMSAPAVTVSPDRPAFEVAALLRARGINRVPVVDGENRLLGIVTRDDLLGAIPLEDAP
jgi:CBS domain-containing membrane protein